MAYKGDAQPGWVRARAEGRELNWQQHVAEKTGGIVRLPNLMTAAGIALTALSARYAGHNKPVAATVSTGLGFALDMEGVVARHFGVEDPKWGGRLDQAADAAKAAIVASAMIKHEVMPVGAAMMTYGPKLVGLAAGVAAEVGTHVELPSSKTGKLAEVCRDVMPVGYMIAAAGRKFEKPGIEKFGRTIGVVATAAAFVTGTVAAAGYIRDAWRAHIAKD